MTNQDRALDFVRDNPTLFSKDADWYLKNWHVVAAFEREAIKLIANGREHYSARTIVEVLVHQSAVREVDGDFKIGNDNAPYLARLFVVMHPEHVDFWEYRKIDHEDFLEAISQLTAGV